MQDKKKVILSLDCITTLCPLTVLMKLRAKVLLLLTSHSQTSNQAIYSCCVPGKQSKTETIQPYAALTWCMYNIQGYRYGQTVPITYTE